ncbi:MAG: hypothetical protein LBH47_03205 [Christensenellaceae bacterium]|jgi:hypothetical protein|nr:hypothetical protein [Christensenellaceae bacterium]
MKGIQLNAAGIIADTANNGVIKFNTTNFNNDTNITYDSGTGICTFAAAANYYVSWNITPNTILTKGGTFAILSGGISYPSSSGINNTEITGSIILEVSAGQTLSLVNQSGGTAAFNTNIPTTAGLTILNLTDTSQDGFSARISTLSVSSSVQLTNWTVTSPYFSSPNFNAATGNYTVPATGNYIILATINFATSGAITASIGSGVNPSFVVARTSPTSTPLITALLPILNLNLTLITIRAILGTGNINLAGEVQLTAGDVISLSYQSSGLTLALNLGDASSGIVWSVQRVS